MVRRASRLWQLSEEAARSPKQMGSRNSRGFSASNSLLFTITMLRNVAVKRGTFNFFENLCMCSNARLCSHWPCAIECIRPCLYALLCNYRRPQRQPHYRQNDFRQLVWRRPYFHQLVFATRLPFEGCVEARWLVQDQGDYLEGSWMDPPGNEGVWSPWTWWCWFPHWSQVELHEQAFGWTVI